MDIEAIATVNEDDGVFEHFKDSTGALLYDGEDDAKAPVGAWISGTYSTFYLDAQARLRQDAYKAARRGDMPDEKEMDALNLANELALETACVRRWTFSSRGAPLPVTVENYKALLRKQPQWRFAVQRRMHDHASFSNAA